MDHHKASTSGFEQMPESTPMFRPQKPQQLTQYIYQLYKPENGYPTMEILFFHGLQFGHSSDPPYLSTWRTDDTTKEVWPGTWLPELFPQAHIFTISYDASTKTTREHGRLDLHNLAENLVQDISSVGIGQGFRRPVIFIGHCFGGLAIKELLVQADHPHHSRGPDSERNQQIEKFLKNSGGVFFYGTPHHGSHLFDKAAYFLDGPLLHYVKSLSKDPARLEQQFVSVRDKYNIHYIASVGESYDTSWGGGLYSGLVVPEGSARYPSGDFYTVAADHFSLCKPAEKNSSSFQRLIGFIQSIAPKVQGEACFEKILPRVPKAAVGLHLGVEYVRKMLERNRSVGIVGMGGIGKTTLARDLLNKLGPTFEFTCFISVVKEITGTWKEVKKEMWKNMQCGNKMVANPDTATVFEDWSQLVGKKLLLVLDDVASSRDFEGWLDIVDDVAPTSRLVATSRNSKLLKTMPLDDLYLVPFLNEKDAKQLFVNYAFPSQLAPPLTLEHHVDSLVKKCDGLPLTLEVLGKYLKGEQNGELWKQTLEALDNANHVAGLDEKLWAKLKVSYFNLEEEEQQMFLDATTFFSRKDWTLRKAKAAWSVNYGSEELRWHTLVHRSLVYDGKEDEPIKVHEQLQSLGRKLALDDKCIRSWKSMEGWNLLQSVNIADDQEIRSLRLSPFKRKDGDYVHIDYAQVPVLKSGLSRLKKVQYLDIVCGDKYYRDIWSEQRGLKRPLEETLGQPGTLSFKDLLKKILPVELVLLRSPTLQLGPICHKPILLHRLAVLELALPDHVKHLPGSIGQLFKLKILRIEAERLIELPNEIGNLSQLERLTFMRCENLKTLPNTFGLLSNLKFLKFMWCLKLHSLPECFGQLHMLGHLIFRDCWQLHTLPKSLGQLCQLELLNLRECNSLQTLLESIGQLSHLKYFELTGSPHLETLPTSFGQWPSLEKLVIYWCPIKTLPFSPGHLKALHRLVIFKLSLVSIPDWIQNLPLLQTLELGSMEKLKEFPPWLQESLPIHLPRDEVLKKDWKFCRTKDGHFILS